MMISIIAPYIMMLGIPVPVLYYSDTNTNHSPIHYDARYSRPLL